LAVVAVAELLEDVTVLEPEALLETGPESSTVAQSTWCLRQ
jgi:hypothetical protein